jgi:hypothetical protein
LGQLRAFVTPEGEEQRVQAALRQVAKVCETTILSLFANVRGVAVVRCPHCFGQAAMCVLHTFAPGERGGPSWRLSAPEHALRQHTAIGDIHAC